MDFTNTYNFVLFSLTKFKEIYSPILLFKALAFLVVYEKVNTNIMPQVGRPYKCLRPNCCV